MKYKSIFVDEIQDYKPEWIKIIRKYFLEEKSEMVLFGDEKQNIYERQIDDEKNTKVVQGFGRWRKLNKSIRQKEDSHILNLAKQFQKIYLSRKYEVDSYSDSTTQKLLMNFGINKICKYTTGSLDVLLHTIYENIKKEKIHPNDVTILCSKIETLREIDYLIRTNSSFNERTLTTFENKEYFDSGKFSFHEIKNIRKSRKIGFNLNSGVIKLATTHSFKGYESPTVFLIIDDNDQDEMLYVGLTRAKFNLMVFTTENFKYNDFFESVLQKDYNKTFEGTN